MIQVHAVCFLSIERPRAESTEDGDLMATFVDGSISIHAATDGQCVTFLRQLVGCDQFWRRTWAESVVTFQLGARQLHDAQAVLAVGNIGEQADVGDAQLNIFGIIDFPFRRIDLVDEGGSRISDVQDNQTAFSRCDISIRSGHINRVGLGNHNLAQALALPIP